MSLIVRDTMTPSNDSQQQNISLTNDSLSTLSGLSDLTGDRKILKAMTPSSSSAMDMPSPPLSPYTRNNYDDNDTIPALLFPRASKPLTSDLRYLELISSSTTSVPVSSTQSSKSANFINSAKSVSPPPSAEPIELSPSAEPIPEIASPIEEVHEEEEVLQQQPLNESTLLRIDPYRSLNKPGFKKTQLNFLSQYQFKNLNSFGSNSYSYLNNGNNHSSSNNNSSKRQRTVRHSYDSLKNNHDNSNSDSELERPRTRRIVRQNNFDLEIDENTNYDSSSISRPSTPVKKRVNTSTPSTPKRQRASTPVVYNYDYKKIEDFCPGFDTLPNNNKCLKTDWKGQSMDLSNDPLVNELHPAEVVLASILRLPCAVYLDSKRRIFQEKVKRMRYNLPFRRTDAQKSCKIDVNKASRLFASFEKVGWFNESHFQKYL